ncbi:hypothetical protein CUMW_262710, partial [Citrus unshiu]
MDPHDVDVEDKADWSSRTKTIFICIVHDHVKKESVWSEAISKMNNNNNNEDDDIDSLTYIEVATAIKIYEKQQRTIKRQCYTGQLSGIDFVQELLHGHPNRMIVEQDDTEHT